MIYFHTKIAIKSGITLLMFIFLPVRLLFREFSTIVVASTGRAGSTMLSDALAESIIQHKFGLMQNNVIAKLLKRLCSGYLNRISQLSTSPFVINKTHDLYEPSAKDGVKYVFVYGDPLDSAMSAEQVVKSEGVQWFRLHQYHLKANGSYSDLFEKDVLNYEKQMESWLAQYRENVICIDYEDLWDKQQNLSVFLGLNVQLPPKRPRQPKPARSNINQNLFDSLRNLKAMLKKQYESSNVPRHPPDLQ